MFLLGSSAQQFQWIGPALPSGWETALRNQPATPAAPSHPISFLHHADWNQEKAFLCRRICGLWA